MTNYEELPKGIAAIHDLPYDSFDGYWKNIILDDPKQKMRILNQGILNFTLRPKIKNDSSLPMHGLILLIGPPGTGKTSLAKGLANQIANNIQASTKKKFRYLEVEPHSLASSGLGASQKNVHVLLNEVIPEQAQSGPLIVLLDEIETLAANRSKLSLDANPFDVHKATDAMLAGLDRLTETCKELLFVATSNFAGAIDPALLSRADMVEEIPLPNAETAKLILNDTVRELIKIYPNKSGILMDGNLEKAAEACQGLDGRQIRKLIITACAIDASVANNPSNLGAMHILEAAELAKATNGKLQ